MPKIAYITKNFGADKQAKIDKANQIIAEYQAQGFELTLRQLYYQFVARDIIANNMREYKNLGEAINDGRLAGQIDWNAIVDRTRNLQSRSKWSDPAEIIAVCASQFHVDMWEGQTYRPEVWIEKDALVGVVEPVCNRNDVAYFSCRGYTSQSELWSAGRRLARYRHGKQIPIVLHLGDHDPSGKDMTRDITDRLEMFAGGAVEVVRLALNMDQIKKLNPPPNPAKLTDSRADGYVAEFGSESWELDALDPKYIDNLIQKALDTRRDKAPWADRQRVEKEGREQLKKVSDRWDDVVAQF